MNRAFTRHEAAIGVAAVVNSWQHLTTGTCHWCERRTATLHTKKTEAASDRRHVSLVRGAHSEAAYKEDRTGKRGIDCNYRLRMESVDISRLRRRRGLNVAASPSIADLSEQACASGCCRVHSPRCDTLRCQTGYCAPL